MLYTSFLSCFQLCFSCYSCCRFFHWLSCWGDISCLFHRSSFSIEFFSYFQLFFNLFPIASSCSAFLFLSLARARSLIADVVWSGSRKSLRLIQKTKQQQKSHLLPKQKATFPNNNNKCRYKVQEIVHEIWKRRETALPVPSYLYTHSDRRSRQFQYRLFPVLVRHRGQGDKTRRVSSLPTKCHKKRCQSRDW